MNRIAALEAQVKAMKGSTSSKSLSFDPVSAIGQATVAVRPVFVTQCLRLSAVRAWITLTCDVVTQCLRLSAVRAWITLTCDVVSAPRQFAPLPNTAAAAKPLRCGRIVIAKSKRLANKCARV